MVPLAIAGGPAFAYEDCTGRELFYGAEPAPTTGHLITDIASHIRVPDACKHSVLQHKINSLKVISRPSFCPSYRSCPAIREAVQLLETILEMNEPFCVEGGACSEENAGESCQRGEYGDYEANCELNPNLAGMIYESDELIGEASREETNLVMEKIDRGLIPYCLLPPECHSDKDKCGVYLSFTWDQAPTKKTSTEYWINRGFLLHLLLSDAFSCSAGTQVGGTCSYYSGVNLTSHYCSTPARNPYAIDSCATRGPDFKCISAEEFAAKLSDDHRAARPAELIPIYNELGFKTYGRLFSDPDAWSQVLISLEKGHPVQISFNTKDLSYYEGGWHAVVLEGVYDDEKGTKRLIFIDSNHDEYAKFRSANLIKEKTIVKEEDGEFITICPASDAGRCQAHQDTQQRFKGKPVAAPPVHGMSPQ